MFNECVAYSPHLTCAQGKKSILAEIPVLLRFLLQRDKALCAGTISGAVVSETTPVLSDLDDDLAFCPPCFDESQSLAGGLE
jgi:hypothetical protein